MVCKTQCETTKFVVKSVNQLIFQISIYSGTIDGIVSLEMHGATRQAYVL